MKLSDIATALDARLVGDGSIEIDRPVHPADASGPRDLALAMEPTTFALLKSTRARAAVVTEGTAPPADGAIDSYIAVGRAPTAMVRLTHAFDRPVHSAPGIHALAAIAADAKLGRDVRIGPFCFIGPKAEIGDGAVLLANVTVGAEAIVGPGSLLHPGVRIGERVVIGARAIVHHNASIGNDGFSFVTPEPGSVETAKATGAVGATNQQILRINSIGTVVLGDDVEVGANTCIDRGTVSATRVGRNTKIDNLVMIGHNCVIGENCMLCGQVGIAGSSVIGDRVVLGARVGVADHLTIGNDSILAGGAMVGHNVPPRSLLVGSPPLPRQQAYELLKNIRRLGRLFEDVAALKRRLEGK